MRKAIILFAIVVAIVGATATLAIRKRAREHMGEADQLLQAQQLQIASMSASNQSLSNSLAQAQATPANVEDARTAELKSLRERAAGLRQRTNEMIRQRDAVRSSEAGKPAQVPVTNSEAYYAQLRKSSGNSPTHGRDIATGMNMYAREHDGQFPTNLDLVVPYLANSGFASAGIAGITNFEIVFHGSVNDLTNIPLHSVILIRERQPWVARDGKLGRVYGTADGASLMVTSNDNFQAWESKHLVAPSPNQRAK